jgi:hypothetical protein
MHNDLAWSVLGVDPAIHKHIEQLAGRQSITIGRFLELMIHSVTVRESGRLKMQKQLRGLVADMADSVMEAVDLLDEEPNGMPSAGKQKQPPSQAPQAAVPTEPDHTEEKEQEEKSPSKLTDLRRGFLRRSA